MSLVILYWYSRSEAKAEKNFWTLEVGTLLRLGIRLRQGNGGTGERAPLFGQHAFKMYRAGAPDDTGLAGCITSCYTAPMKTVPMPLRLDKQLQKTLREGARRTPHKKQELIRLTLRRYLPAVIEEEAVVKAGRRVTNIEPWPASVVEKAYERIGKEWDTLEELATAAQGKPGFND